MRHNKTTDRIYWVSFLIFILLAFIALVGCSNSFVSLLREEPTISISPSASYNPLSSPEITETPITTGSDTPSPTIINTPSPSSTATSTPTGTPTLTPLPTISPENRGEVYYGLISSNGGCELPCWWGFDLGKTPVGEVAQFYSSLTNSVSLQRSTNELSVLYTKFQDPQIEDGVQVGHSFLVRNGVVIEANIELNVQPDYQIRSILKRFGRPEEVWMWTIPQPYQGILPARFRLYFPELGIFIVYGTPGVKVNDNVEVCFNKPGGVSLLLWDPGNWDPDRTKDIEDRANESSSAFNLEGFPIEIASNWNTEQFYNNLIDPENTECLQTPSNLWPHP